MTSGIGSSQGGPDVTVMMPRRPGVRIAGDGHRVTQFEPFFSSLSNLAVASRLSGRSPSEASAAAGITYTRADAAAISRSVADGKASPRARCACTSAGSPPPPDGADDPDATSAAVTRSFAQRSGTSVLFGRSHPLIPRAARSESTELRIRSRTSFASSDGSSARPSLCTVGAVATVTGSASARSHPSNGERAFKERVAARYGREAEVYALDELTDVVDVQRCRDRRARFVAAAAERAGSADHDRQNPIGHP
jgi:hypothetical protein